MTTDDDFMVEGVRDDQLFSLAWHLLKSGMPTVTVRDYTLFFAQHCTPPFPEKEASVKVDSALKRLGRENRNLSEEVRNEIELTKGVFLSSAVCQELTLSSRTEKKNLSKILCRLCDEGVLERVGYGKYRKIDQDSGEEDWRNAETDTVKLWLPFDLGDIVEVMPGDIILIAGSQNSGKSALAMNIAKENRFDWNVHYFSSELRAGGFKRRMQKFPEVLIQSMEIKFYRRTSDWHDVIKTGGGNLNILDYIELHDNFYQIAGILAKIHEKLNGAIAVCCIQKDPKQLYGRGGSFTQEKPVLSLSLDSGTATISKCKEWQENVDNPNNMRYDFKLVDGCRLIKERGWHIPFEEGE
jgi:hypothetical protein